MQVSSIDPFLKIFIGPQLLCNVTLDSTVQETESALCTHTSPLFRLTSQLGHRGLGAGFPGR